VTETFDCRGLAKRYRDWCRERAALLDFTPGIATILVKGRVDPGSLQYRDMIVKDAGRLGFSCRSVEVGDEKELVRAIGDLNMDASIQGIVVLYPLGLSRSDDEIMDLVTPRKDIEGLHSLNLGYLIKYRRFLKEEAGLKCVVPATAKAVVKSLQAHPVVPIEGSFVTIVNNSMRVGKPLGLMLENLGATVIKCYDRTRREVLEDSVRRADILVTAVPDPSFRIDPGWIKKGAAVVDVSYQGNVDSEALDGRAAVRTAPDNRVGRVTRALMFVNLLYSCGPQPSFDPREAAVR
jgi:5,10-methylene-tetrahydrofolate dehydrogenase/methenyl tetrahydrofolate cyclohydrolase